MHYPRRLAFALILLASSAGVVGGQSVLRLEPNISEDFSDFGRRIAVWGDVVAVSGPGFVEVFDRTTGTPVRHITSPTGDYNFGAALAPLGTDLLVGAPFDLSGGVAGKVFRVDPLSGASVQTYLSPQFNCSNCTGNFGAATVAVGGDVFVGAPNHDTLAAAKAGAAYLFDATTGALLRTFTSPHPTSTSVVAGNFGRALADAGGDVLIGAPYDVPIAGRMGAAYLFDTATGAVLQEFLNPVPDTGGVDTNFGVAVAAFGGTIAVGAPKENTSGAVHLFDAATGALVRTLVSPNTSTPCPIGCRGFGVAIATLGTRLLVGAPFDDVDGVATGAAYLFDGTTGALERTLRNPTPGSGDGHGASVAAADGTFAIGAPGDEGVGRDSLGFGTGSSHVFYGGVAGCGPCETSGPLGTCVSAPNPTCRPPAGPGKAAVKIVDSPTNTRDRVTWRWKGRAKTIEDFGHPLSGGDLTLCVWDESGPTAALLFRAGAPDDTSCMGSSCWTVATRTVLVSYKDRERTPDGLKTVRLVASGAGPFGHMMLTGTGEALSGRPLGLPTLPPPLPLRVQLQAREGLCWESHHSVAGPPAPPRFSSVSD